MATNRMLAHPETTRSLAPAASRASWVGTLKIGETSVPVKAFTAIASSSSTQLHQIHVDCGRRIAYRKTCPRHGPVDVEQIGKAYEYSSDCVVELSEDELAKLRPVDDKTITLERFFSRQHLDLTLLAGRSLFLAPANLAAQRDFSAFEGVLKQKRLWALGRTVFSHRPQLVVIQSCGTALLLHTLHSPETRRAAVTIQTNGKKALRKDVRKLINFIDNASDPFDWSDYRDDFSERLASLVRSKIDGKANGRAKKTPARRKSNGRRQSRPRTAARAA